MEPVARLPRCLYTPCATQYSPTWPIAPSPPGVHPRSGVEEQFYLLFPVLMVLAYASRVCESAGALLPASALRAHPRALPPLLIGGLSLASFAVAYPLTTAEPDAAFYLMPLRLWELAAGALLVDALQPASRRSPALPAALGRSRLAVAAMDFGAAALIGTSFVVVQPADGHFPLPWALLPVAGTLLFIAAGTPVAAEQPAPTPAAPAVPSEGASAPHGRDIHCLTPSEGASAPHGRDIHCLTPPVRPRLCGVQLPLLNRLLSLPPVVYVGKLSYPLYLWHWPIFVAFKWTCGFERAWQQLLAVALSFALAALTYHTAEAAARSWRPKRPARVFVLLLPTALVAAWLWVLREHGASLYVGDSSADDRADAPSGESSVDSASALAGGGTPGVASGGALGNSTAEERERADSFLWSFPLFHTALATVPYMQQRLCQLRQQLRAMAPRAHHEYVVMAGDSTMRNQMIALCLAVQGQWWVAPTPEYARTQELLRRGNHSWGAEVFCGAGPLNLTLAYTPSIVPITPARRVEDNGWGFTPTALYMSSGLWLMWPEILTSNLPQWDESTYRAWREYGPSMQRAASAAVGLAPQAAVAVATTHSLCVHQFGSSMRNIVTQPYLATGACATSLQAELPPEEHSLRDPSRPATFDDLRLDCAEGLRTREAAIGLNGRLRDALAQLPLGSRAQVRVVDLFNLTDGRCEMNVGNDPMHFHALLFDEVALLLTSLGWIGDAAGTLAGDGDGGSGGGCLLDERYQDPVPALRDHASWPPLPPADAYRRYPSG